ncbi:hypothetical protein ACFVJ4_36420 [Streptomyces sp. NPDC127178]|uniref:hypothetical protein n=1 Tax=unclassified Streptomyces TaxID=2593676 RepID=UPI00363CB2CC
MSESTASATELTSQYMSQVTGDLDRNVKEQERITAEISVLQEQLAVLQRDYSTLDSVRRALGGPATPVAAEETADSTVPPPRKQSAAAGRKPAKKSTPPQLEASKRPRRKATTATQAERPTQPTLVTLVSRHLADQSEPRSAAEIATVLGKAHPERNIQTTVVRNTLENLVAKSKAERTKQGSSVFYAASTEPAAAPKAQAQVDSAV